MQPLLERSGGLGGIPDNVGEVFGEAYRAGIRIHTNSWGSTTSGLICTYDNAGTQIDAFVKKYPDMVVSCAAGNEGVDVVRNGVVDFK